MYFPQSSIAGLEAQANGLPVLFSTAVPKECAVLDYKFLSLDSGAGNWASEIADMKGQHGREEAWGFIKKSKFDKEYYVKQLERIYLDFAGKRS